MPEFTVPPEWEGRWFRDAEGDDYMVQLFKAGDITTLMLFSYATDDVVAYIKYRDPEAAVAAAEALGAGMWLEDEHA